MSNIVCSECVESLPEEAYYTNGKQGRHSKCIGCWTKQGINGYQGELKRRFFLEQDEMVCMCMCGRFYTKFKLTPLRKKTGPERTRCTICAKK
jgi:hypothetical protein